MAEVSQVEPAAGSSPPAEVKDAAKSSTSNVASAGVGKHVSWASLLSSLVHPKDSESFFPNDVFNRIKRSSMLSIFVSDKQISEWCKPWVLSLVGRFLGGLPPPHILVTKMRKVSSPPLVMDMQNNFF